MEPEQNPVEQPASRFENLHKVTPLSKYLAMGLFVILPFVGGWIGYVYAPDKIIEVETSSQREIRDSDVGDNILGTTTVDMVSYQIRYSQDKIELLRGPEVVQTIPWDTNYRSFYTDDESLLITNWDINFDGYLDLGILTNVGSGGANRFFHFYTFDSETYSLIKMDDFDTFEPDISNLVNPHLDIGSKTITTGMRSGPSWTQEKYIFYNGKYISEKESANLFDEQTDKVSCRIDSDCVLVQPDCEDCTFDVIAKDDVDIFRMQKSQRCELNPPRTQCDSVFNGEVRCVENFCQILP